MVLKHVCLDYISHTDTHKQSHSHWQDWAAGCSVVWHTKKKTQKQHKTNK